MKALVVIDTDHPGEITQIDLDDGWTDEMDVTVISANGIFMMRRGESGGGDFACFVASGAVKTIKGSSLGLPVDLEGWAPSFAGYGIEIVTSIYQQQEWYAFKAKFDKKLSAVANANGWDRDDTVTAILASL